MRSDPGHVGRRTSRHFALENEFPAQLQEKGGGWRRRRRKMRRRQGKKKRKRKDGKRNYARMEASVRKVAE